MSECRLAVKRINFSFDKTFSFQYRSHSYQEISRLIIKLNQQKIFTVKLNTIQNYCSKAIRLKKVIKITMNNACKLKRIIYSFHRSYDNLMHTGIKKLRLQFPSTGAYKYQNTIVSELYI